jgi:hypothetical protein
MTAEFCRSLFKTKIQNLLQNYIQSDPRIDQAVIESRQNDVLKILHDYIDWDTGCVEKVWEDISENPFPRCLWTDLVLIVPSLEYLRTHVSYFELMLHQEHIVSVERLLLWIEATPGSTIIERDHIRINMTLFFSGIPFLIYDHALQFYGSKIHFQQKPQDDNLMWFKVKYYKILPAPLSFSKDFFVSLLGLDLQTPKIIEKPMIPLNEMKNPYMFVEQQLNLFNVPTPIINSSITQYFFAQNDFFSNIWPRQYTMTGMLIHFFDEDRNMLRGEHLLKELSFSGIEEKVNLTGKDLCFSPDSGMFLLPLGSHDMFNPKLSEPREQFFHCDNMISIVLKCDEKVVCVKSEIFALGNFRFGLSVQFMGLERTNKNIY